MLIISWVVPLLIDLVIRVIRHMIGFRYPSLGMFGEFWVLWKFIGWVVVAMINILILSICLYYYIEHFGSMNHFCAVLFAIGVMFAPFVVVEIFRMLVWCLSFFIFRPMMI